MNHKQVAFLAYPKKISLTRLKKYPNPGALAFRCIFGFILFSTSRERLNCVVACIFFHIISSGAIASQRRHSIIGMFSGSFSCGFDIPDFDDLGTAKWIWNNQGYSILLGLDFQCKGTWIHHQIPFVSVFHQREKIVFLHIFSGTKSILIPWDMRLYGIKRGSYLFGSLIRVA